MLHLHPQYIKDAQGHNSMVILPAKEYESILEELEELEDVRAYDDVKKGDDGERIAFSDYLTARAKNNE